MKTTQVRLNRVPLVNKDLLIEEYVNKRRSIASIAEEFKCARQTVSRRCRYFGIEVRTSQSRLLDLTGRHIGKWTVLKRILPIVRGRFLYLCRCSCGVEKKVRQINLLDGRSKSCIRCAHPGSYKHSKWKGYGEISGRKWHEIIWNATRRGTRPKRNIAFSITVEYAWNLFLEQDRRCALSGLPIKFQKDYKDKGGTTASLDQIVPSGGYTERNVQWLHKDVNRMKNRFDQPYFIEMCRKIANRSSRKRF